jgi:phage terminase large subunit-like protein
MIVDNYVRNPFQLRAERAYYAPNPYVLNAGGSGGGKSFGIMAWIIERCIYCPGSRNLILRRTRTAVKDTLWSQVLPDVLKAFPGLRETIDLNITDLTVTFRNGSVMKFAGLEEGENRDKVLGQSLTTVWMNECTDFNYRDFEDIDTRLRYIVDGPNGKPIPVKLLLDCNPTKKAHFAYKLFVEKIDPITKQPLVNPNDYVLIETPPEANAANLSADYIEKLKRMSPEARRRFYLGQWGDDVDNALWTEANVNEHRVPAQTPQEWRERLTRIAISVDPSITANDKSDECGITVQGIDADGHGYVLEDLSMKAVPDVWGKAVIEAYQRWQADLITVEGNQGKLLLNHLLNSIDPTAAVKLTTAYKDKVSRAEPVSALYARGLVHHAGVFDRLEDQMYAIETGYKKGMRGKSPDRVDAMVWGFTELMVAKGPPKPGAASSHRIGGLFGR